MSRELERSLVRRAKDGDTEAFSKLYETVYMDLYKFARYVLRNPVEAEDAVSAAVIIAFENIASLRRSEAFRSWMFRIVINQCNQICKKRVPGAVPYEEVEMGQEPDYENRQMIWDAFGCLEPREQNILALSIFGGYRSWEIGRMLKMNPGTVRSVKSRSLSHLRQLLGGAL